jgi:hypothetical protein
MLALEPSVVYLHEPFNLDHDRAVCGATFDHWFTYVCPENEGRYRDHFARTMRLQYDVVEKLRTSRSPRQAGKALRTYAGFLRRRMGRARPLLKDPIALFSAEWLADAFDMNVVVMIRHPAAFAGSVKAKNWRFPFEHFLQQPLLMRDRLAAYAPEIESYAVEKREIVDQAALLWRLMHDVILEYKARHPNWLFVRHEDLSREPIGGYERLYRSLELRMDERIAAVIREHTTAKEKSTFKRDSASNIGTWRDRLTPEEIARVRARVEDVSREFYSDAEWDRF